MSNETITNGGWLAQNVGGLKTTMRIVMGLVWGIDGTLKFQPGFADKMASLVSGAGAGQPAWLEPWFDFWSATVARAPWFFAALIGTLELALAFALIFGFMRKVAYTGGFLLSLAIWSVPEGFGGPYGPGSTDIGTGIIYAFTFVFLLILNATYGPSRWSLDALIESRWPGWAKIAEVRRAEP
ncbi:MAG: hypothetical protein ACYDDF_11930 [Thermoplasmatota archaeon]